MLEAAQKIVSRTNLFWITDERLPQYTPSMFVGGNGVTGSAYVDNDGYRKYLFREFEARSVDREAGAVAHIAYQNNIPFLFLHSLSKLAGSDEKIPDTYEAVAADNTRTVILNLIRALYTNDFDRETIAPTENGGSKCSWTYWNLLLCVGTSLSVMLDLTC